MIITLILAFALSQTPKDFADTTITFTADDSLSGQVWISIDSKDQVGIHPKMAQVCDPARLRRSARQVKHQKSKQARRYIYDCIRKAKTS